MIFQKVVFRIPFGTVLGEARMRGNVIDEMRWNQSKSTTAEFNVGVTDALRELGFEMRDSADALFEAQQIVDVRYELAGILHSAKLDFEYKQKNYRRAEGTGKASVDLEIRMRDVIAGKTVYTRTFTGHGEDYGLEPNPIMNAVSDAVLMVATDEDFIALVAKDEPSSTVATTGPAGLIDVPICSGARPRALPSGLPDVLTAVVEVQVGESIGTGTLISSDGFVLTSNHVLGSGEDPEAWIRLSNGIQILAKVDKTNYQSDVALLRISGRNYPCAYVRRDAKRINLGADVFAINLAIGEKREPTVSRGVVSGFPVGDQATTYIQTDASVNPGSSGGPLFSSEGLIAGVTVQKVMAVGVEGLGFAVPIRDALESLGVSFVSE